MSGGKTKAVNAALIQTLRFQGLYKDGILICYT